MAKKKAKEKKGTKAKGTKTKSKGSSTRIKLSDAGIKKANEARSFGSDFEKIKYDEGNNFLYLLSDDVESGSVHWIGNKPYRCPSNRHEKLRDNKNCPACKTASIYYDKKKKTKSKKEQKYIDAILDEIKTRISNVTVAAKGVGVTKKKVKGKSFWVSVVTIRVIFTDITSTL